MRRILAITLGSLALAVVLGGSALAASPAASAGPSSRPAPTVRFDFEEDHVLGTMSGPLIDITTGRGGSKHSSLIKIRTHFVPELFRSVNDL